MSLLFEITLSMRQRATPEPFEEDDYEDASPLFLALERLLAAEEGQFEVRIGALVLPFDLDPDLSTVFQDLPDVLAALASDTTRPVELHFYEQGTDLFLLLQRRGSEIDIQIRRGPSSGPRYAAVPSEPMRVQAVRFLEQWGKILWQVLEAVRRVQPHLERDPDYQLYAAKVRALRATNTKSSPIEDRLNALAKPPLARPDPPRAPLFRPMATT